MSNIYESDKPKLGELVHAIEVLIDELNKVKEDQLQVRGLTNLVGKNYDDFHIEKVGKKFAYLNTGGPGVLIYTNIKDYRKAAQLAIDYKLEAASGCFLIELGTGELYNIKGYGVPDYNKKKKSDIGNVFTVDAAWLYGKRWNYLR